MDFNTKRLPVARDDEGLLETVLALAARHGLGAHGIRIYGDRHRHAKRLGI